MENRWGSMGPQPGSYGILYRAEVNYFSGSLYLKHLHYGKTFIVEEKNLPTIHTCFFLLFLHFFAFLINFIYFKHIFLSVQKMHYQFLSTDTS